LLPSPSTGVLLDVVDMNEAGVVVGNVGGVNESTLIYLWEPGAGAATLIEPPTDLSYYARAINDDGMIAGIAFDFSQGNQWRYPFVWDDASGFTRLNVFDSQWAGAVDINNDGRVVGFYSVGSSIYIQGFSWDVSAGAIDLGNFNDGEVVPHAVNESGVIAGMATDTVYHTFRWSDAGGLEKIVLSTPRLAYTCPASVNAEGAIAGELDTPQGERRAFYWTATAGLTTIPSGTRSSAVAMNDHGQVIGYTGFWPGSTFFLWSPSGGYQILGTQGGSSARLDAAVLQASFSLPC
ncbi:MAG TPA: hypothetical protein VFO52_06400, partial [Longimicrobiales bacterium]|nr:hypothetical protein [Longimicrobiales bacterium]